MSKLTQTLSSAPTGNQTPKERLLEALKDIPRLSFSRRSAATPEEGADLSVLWGVKSLREVVKEADRRFGTAPKGGRKPSGVG